MSWKKSRRRLPLYKCCCLWVLPLLVLPVVAAFGVGATSILLILAPFSFCFFFCFKVECEFAFGFLGAGHRVRLRLLLIFSSLFCSTFASFGVLTRSSPSAVAPPLPDTWAASVLAAHFQIDYKQDMHCGSVFDGSASRRKAIRRGGNYYLLPIGVVPCVSLPHRATHIRL